MDEFQKKAASIDEQVNSQLVGEFFDEMRQEIQQIIEFYTKTRDHLIRFSDAIGVVKLHVLDIEQRTDKVEKFLDEKFGTKFVEEASKIKQEQIEAQAIKTKITKAQEVELKIEVAE